MIFAEEYFRAVDSAIPSATIYRIVAELSQKAVGDNDFVCKLALLPLEYIAPVIDMVCSPDDANRWYMSVVERALGFIQESHSRAGCLPEEDEILTCPTPVECPLVEVVNLLAHDLYDPGFHNPVETDLLYGADPDEYRFRVYGKAQVVRTHKLIEKDTLNDLIDRYDWGFEHFFYNLPESEEE